MALFTIRSRVNPKSKVAGGFRNEFGLIIDAIIFCVGAPHTEDKAETVFDHVGLSSIIRSGSFLPGASSKALQSSLSLFQVTKRNTS
jgi:hypothetical protein